MNKVRLTILSLLFISTTAMARWSSNPAEALWINSDSKYFYSYAVEQAPNGNTWFYLNGDGDTHYVQLFDSTGVAMLGEEMMLVSDHRDRLTGYIGQNLFVDRDGNAIVIVSDLRYSPDSDELGSYTAYKISQSGEMLWGEGGIPIDNGEGRSINAFVSVTQLSDGDYVFSWLHSDYDQTIFSIDVQRVNSQGELLWDPVETRLTDPDKKITYFWPYIVDAGMGQCILVYTKGSNYELYARKLDFDGTSAWSEDTRIYHGGFLSTPLNTLLDVEPSGDGGVIVTWYDDRYYTNTESIYMSYVKPNGSLGFAAGEAGQKLGYSELRALSTTCKYDPASDSFIALWRESDQGQGQFRVVAQRVSKEGELLWDEDGLEVEPLEERVLYGDLTLQLGEEGEVVAFYMKRNTFEYGNVDVRMQRINTLDGTLVWDESKILTDTQSPTEKTDMQVTEIASRRYAVFGWDDRGVTSDPDYKRLYLNRVNYDGTLGCKGDAAVTETAIENNDFVAIVTVDNVDFVVDSKQAAQAIITVYNLDGTIVAQPFIGQLNQGRQCVTWHHEVSTGVYLATLTTPQGLFTTKIFIK